MVLFTPTHAKDLDYFRFLRESARRWCPEIRHVVVVHSEDLSHFEEFRDDPRVELFGARQVLEAADIWRTTPRTLLNRVLRRRTIEGWYAQQLVKLAAPKIVDAPVYVCIDSDQFFIRPFGFDDVHDETGKVFLCEHKYHFEGQHVEWNRRALELFGLPTSPDPDSNFVEATVPLHAGTVRRMQEFIEKRYKKPWYVEMAERQVTEYPAYGIFATRVDGRRDVGRSIGTDSYYSRCIWDEDSPEGVAQSLWDRTVPRHVKVAGIYGAIRIPTSEYRPMVKRIWERSAAE